MTDDGFAAQVHAVAERRLAELGVHATRRSDEETAARFDRRAVSGSELHLEVTVSGSAAVLTITPHERGAVDSGGPRQAVSEEVARLQGLGRIVPFHQVMVGSRGLVLLDLVPAARPPAPPEFAYEGRELVEGVLDHESVVPLMR